MVAFSGGDPQRPKKAQGAPERCEDGLEETDGSAPHGPGEAPSPRKRRATPTKDKQEQAHPPSRSPSPPSYTRANSESGGGEGSAVNDDSGAAGDNNAKPPVEDGPALKAAKAFGLGLGAIVAVPFVAAGGAVWGVSKILQGVGTGLAAGPEAAGRAVKAWYTPPSKGAGRGGRR